jgi:hypothetical protein
MTTSHFNTSWQDQHERVGRWHKRLTAIRRGIRPDMSQAEALDDVYAFFMNCYHLRDWIINSGFRKKEDVDAFIAATPELQLCADICNGLKHFRLDPKRALSAPTWSTASEVTFSFPPGVSSFIPGVADQPASISGPRWAFTTDGAAIGMFELADKCVGAWDRFLAGP